MNDNVQNPMSSHVSNHARLCRSRRLRDGCRAGMALFIVLLWATLSPGIADEPVGNSADSTTHAPDAPLDASDLFEVPNPPAAAERKADRERMVERQIAGSRDGRRPVRDKNVLLAMKSVPRHVFVPKSRRRDAYRDSPLPIGNGQTISQPYIVGLMTEQLKLTPESKVLEIGTGSGYQVAILAHLSPHVYTIEIIEPLANRAQKALIQQGYDQIKLHTGDGYFGWEEHAPFDAIIVTCAAGHLPPPLWQQLKPGGRIVIPIGGPYEAQRLVVITKTENGKRRSRTVTGVRFVPMTGQAQRR